MVTLPIPKRQTMTSKASTLTKQINEAKAHQREISAEEMTYYDCTESRYEALADIQAITTKVIQDFQQKLAKDKPRIHEAKHIVIDAQKFMTKLPMVHLSFHQFAQETKEKFPYISTKLPS